MHERFQRGVMTGGTEYHPPKIGPGAGFRSTVEGGE
jgi:hypothetical protein